jgi:hypothetical protein
MLTIKTDVSVKCQKHNSSPKKNMSSFIDMCPYILFVQFIYFGC